MFSSIDEFIKYIPEFENLSPSEMIPFFVYFCNQESGNEVTPKEIKECYDNLILSPYSNISAYLNNKSAGRNAVFLKKKNGYLLTRTYKERLESSLLVDLKLKPTNNLIDLTILSGTPYYIQKTTEQMSCCYDNGLYDACLLYTS